MNKRGLLQWILVAAPAVLAIGVMTVFRACSAKEDGTWMHCYEVQTALAITGVILTLISVAALLISSAGVCILLRLAGIAAAVIAVLLPGTLMKMCMMDTMRCYAVMRPFAWIMGALIALLSLLDLTGRIRQKTK